MLQLSLVSQGIRAHLYTHPGDTHLLQDRWLARETTSGLRLGVVDGCTPWRTETYPGNDAAAYAAETLTHYCGLNLTLNEAFTLANSSLHNPNLEFARQQAMAAAAVIDCSPPNPLTPSIIEYTGIVSGDCEIWCINPARNKGEPFLAAGGRAFTEEALAEWLSYRGPQETKDQKFLREAQVFEQEKTWLCPATGRYSKPGHSETVGQATTIILASDGANLSEAFAQGITMETLEEWLHGESHKTNRDDITCITITAETSTILND